MARATAISEEVLRDRMPVWAAISELFLDTELDDADHRRIASTLASSPYGADELQRIYAEEVAPILHWNLKVPAGVWGAFDLEWLSESIATRVRKRRPISRLLAALGISTYLVTLGTRDDWFAVMSYVFQECKGREVKAR